MHGELMVKTFTIPELTHSCAQQNRREAEEKFWQNLLTDRLFTPQTPGLLICRARRRTHDTSRTTRHARHDHGTGTVQRRNVLISRSGNLRFTPPTSDVCQNTNNDKNSHGGDSLNKSMRPIKNGIEIIQN